MHMRFHKELYVGDSIKNARKVKWKLKHHAGQLSIFVIALSGGSDQLEIYHCAFKDIKSVLQAYFLINYAWRTLNAAIFIK